MSLESAIREARKSQLSAAQDDNQKVRVIAGPGSGKSKVIEDRVKWLLDNGVNPRTIVVLSFTRASVKDLKDRILARCEDSQDAPYVRISTLHSLALTLLKSQGKLERYPADPQVLGKWELEKIFDPEFGKAESVHPGSRQRQIRLHYEALWETGQEDHPNYRPEGEIISPDESERFNRFHIERTSVYACVLPGEMVAQCLSLINKGLLDPKESINIDHLIVDEYQDLNPTDLEFVNILAGDGVKLFVAGDDDQSIYSFRYASPLGIQKFAENHPESTHHELQHCFRCSPSVLHAAISLITSSQSADRVIKEPIAIYSSAEPALDGFVHRWRFDEADDEAQAIARSCKKLIDAGLSPDDILILLRSPRSLAGPITDALSGRGLPFTSLDTNKITDTATGRALLSILRIACEGSDPKDRDYIAHRALLSLVPRVGVGTCNAICRKIISNNLNYRGEFHRDTPRALFTAGEKAAISKVSRACQIVEDFQVSDTLEQRWGSLSDAVESVISTLDRGIWEALVGTMPEHMTLGELANYMGSEKDEVQQQILLQVRNRLREETAEVEEAPPKIRVLSMHGAKGLSAQVVFVLGLEDNLVPSAKSKTSTGLVQEEARLLYVSITRARAACILSYSRHRVIHGQYTPTFPSEFNTRLGGNFSNGPISLDKNQVSEILEVAARLE